MVVLGAAAALLAFYTLLFGARHPGATAAQADGVVRGLQHAVAAQAAAKTEPAGQTAPAPDSAAPAAAPADTSRKSPLALPDLPPEVWGGDPFVRDWVMVNELANLSLKAITVGGDRAYVLINDQILEEGDVISGKRIVQIENEKITLEQGGRTFTLMLGE
jgi:hypothetical protein